MKLILDVDTGYDDMVALLLAYGTPSLEILGIVAVAGNQILEKTVKNTLNVVSFIGATTPVYKGMNRPILREQITAGTVHGESGLDGPIFPTYQASVENAHGVMWIIETLKTYPKEVTLVATGPLTDIAMAMLLEPKLPSLVKEIVLMGGSTKEGNVTPYAEFNIYADPEAASIVFSSGAPIVMMGLDVTKQVLLDDQRFAQYQKLHSASSTLFCTAMERYIAFCRAHGSEYPAMHDPCCIAYVIDREIFEVEPRHICVDLEKKETYGRTIASEGSSVLVGYRADTEKFWSLMDAAFSHLP